MALSKPVQQFEDDDLITCEERPINRRDRGKTKLDKKKWDKPWKMVKKFGDRGECTLQNPAQVAIDQAGNVAVADYNAARIHVYSIDDGKMKMSIDTTKSLHSNQSDFGSHPSGVAVWKDKYLVCDSTYFPIVYDSSGNYVRQLSTPANCTKDIHTKYSISNSPQGNVIFACVSNHLCFSNVDDDKAASSITTPFTAYYTATSSDDNKIVISANSSSGARVIDTKGQTIHVLSPPIHVTSYWCPSGVCTIGEGDDEEVFVCNGQYGSKPGVYRFSLTTGKYLGCVTTDVSGPRGIAFTDDVRIVVAEKTCVKVFAPSD